MGRSPFRRFPGFELGPAARVGLALAAVALLELGLFALHHRPNITATCSGEGLVIWGDGLGYYAWLRSALVDHDWSFANEFDEHNPLGHWVPPPDARTDLGCRANPFSVGPACCWALTVVPAHSVVCWLHAGGAAWALDGYGWLYQLLVGGTTLLVSLLGLLLLYASCRRYARPVRAALAAVLLTLGTTVVYYSAAEVSVAHGLGTAALAALVWYWLRTYGSDRPGRWLLVGVLVGAAALVRWQLATFAMLPAGEALLAWRRTRSWGAAPLLGLAACGAALAFLPQAIAWRCVYGHWLVAPMPLAHDWLRPSLWGVLGTQDRGLFYWTPLTLLACAGSLWHLRPRWLGRRGALPKSTMPHSPLVLLFGAFLVQVYVLASIRGTGVYAGAAFGCRQLTESLVALAPALALLLEQLRGRCYRFLGMLGCALVLWNLLLIRQYQLHLVPPDAGAEPARLLANLFHLAHDRPSVLLGRIVGVVVIGLLLLPEAKRSLPSGARPAHDHFSNCQTALQTPCVTRAKNS
jgi:hypothetical protein